MNAALFTVGACLNGKKNDFLLGPLFVPCQGGHRGPLKVIRFCLNREPGANVLPYEEVSNVLLYYVWRQWATDKMGILRPDAVGNDKPLHVNIYEVSVLEPLL